MDIKINPVEKKAIEKLKEGFGIGPKNFKIDQAWHIIELDLSNKNLKKIPESISIFSQLKELNLSFNHIQKIESLNNLTQLRKLWLSNNEISKIEGLEKLTNLQELNLLNNNISKIECLDKLNRLQRETEIIWKHIIN